MRVTTITARLSEALSSARSETNNGVFGCAHFWKGRRTDGDNLPKSGAGDGLTCAISLFRHTGHCRGLRFFVPLSSP
jgi:hypothetical protein